MTSPLSGDYRIAASRDAIWAVLSDRDGLQACLPGAEAVTWTDSRITARVPVRGDAPLFFEIHKGATSGAADEPGSIEVSLQDDGNATRLSFRSAEGAIGAKSAVDALAAALAARFPAAAPIPIVTPPNAAARDEAEDRAEHRIEDLAQDLVDTAKIVEADVEIAAGRGFLGGPYVWGLIVILIGVIAIAVVR